MTTSRLNRDTLQRLADLRAAEARLLLDNGHYSGAYYLAGYAVECALKACIAKQVREFDFPNLDLARKSHSHKLTELAKVGRVYQEIEQEIKSNSAFSECWLTVVRWVSESRYSMHTREDAIALLASVTDANNGVLQWIKKRW